MTIMIDEIFAAPKGGDLEEGIAFARDNGLGYELPTLYYPEALDNSPQEVKKYRQLLEGFEGTLAMHGPIFDMNPASPDPKIAEASRYRYHQAIEVALELDVKYLVFHSQYTPIYRAANCVKPWINHTTDFWRETIEKHLAGTQLTVVIENYLDESPEYIQLLIERVASPHLRACLDIGHVNIFSKMAPNDWLDALGNDLVYIHAHNNNGELDEHQSFDKGSIDMEGFLNHLALTTSRAHLALETNSVEGLAESYEITKPYLEIQDEHFSSKSFLV